MPVQNFSTWDARNDTSYSQHVSLSNICSLKNLKKHENNCCAEGHENHVAQKWRIRIVPVLFFKIEHIHYMILGARTLRENFLFFYFLWLRNVPPSFSLSLWKCSPWFFSLKRAEANLILAGHPFPCTGVSDYSREREGVGGGRERKRKSEGGKTD